MKGISAISREAPVLIAGPTASGKSALAMEIAARDGRIVVNADALQVYANWRILTARPSEGDEAALPHALYGHVPRQEAYSVGKWLRDLAPLLAQKVVIVGGTGLYFTCLTGGLAEIPPIPPAVRSAAGARLAEGGIAALLGGIDAETAARIDLRNPVRVQRAWEVQAATGRGLAAWQAETGPPLLDEAGAERLLLMPERDWLARRIALRFSAMIEAGALEEARAELPLWDPDLPSAKAIGAKELIGHLQGLAALSSAIDSAVAATRNYARVQKKWFRGRMADWTLMG